MSESEEFLPQNDWAAVQKRFDAGTGPLAADLIQHEPVLAEAVSTRTVQFHRTIDIQDLTPEVKILLKKQSLRMLLEPMALMRLHHENVMADLLPASDGHDNFDKSGTPQKPKV